MNQSLKYFKNILLASFALLMGSIYVYYWRIGYNADYAMVGLIAKRILETGEQFIFVPNVGYQGLFYEGNLVALMFRLFGVTPTVLNFAPFLTYLGFLFVFYRSVRAWHNPFVASIATLSIIFGTPSFYRVVLRTQPNYGETFLMGSALIWLYRLILINSLNRTLQVSRRNLLLGLYGAFGLIFGFGLYTYGQIVYFMGAIALHATFFLVSDLQARRRNNDPQVRPYLKAIKFLCLYASLGVLLFLFGLDELKFGEKRISWMPYAMIEFGLVASVLMVWISECRHHWGTFKQHINYFVAFIVAFLVGYSPKLYYNLILKIPSKGGGLGRGGTLLEILTRVKFFLLGQFQLMGSSDTFVLTSIIMAIFAVFIFAYIIIKTKKSISLYQTAISNDNVLDKMLSISPFFFLIGVIVIGYISSNSVTDIFTARYTIALFLPYGVAIGCVLELLRMKHNPILLSRIAGVAFTLLIALNIQSSLLAFQDATKPDILENVAKYLIDKDIHHGYGTYWYTYPINLLTNEKVIIDPVSSSYTPFYRAKVQAAQRIAYVDKAPYFLGENVQINQNIKIFDVNYHVIEKKPFTSLDVFILEKT